MCALIGETGRDIVGMSLREMDVFWDMVKQNAKNT
jgi:hypothetical protein